MNSNESVLKIGNVFSVKGRTVEVKVDTNKNTSHLLLNGEILKNVSVGSYIKITKGFEELIGRIEGEYITDDKRTHNPKYSHEQEKIKRILNVKLLGYIESRKFKQGIKELPLIDNECYLLTNEEFDKVHDFIKVINEKPDIPIKIGYLASERGKEIKVGINCLFASHIGIFGNTGSGKSYTLASLYHKLFKKYMNMSNFKKNARFVIIDFNGEYLDGSEDDKTIIDGSIKNIYNLRTDKNSKKKFPISPKQILDNDFWSIFLTATEKTQKPFLRRTLSNDFYFDKLSSEEGFRFAVSNILLAMITKQVDRGDIIQFLYEIKNSIIQPSNISDLINDYQDHLKWHSNSIKYYYEKSTLTIYDNEQDFVEKVIDDKLKTVSFNTGKLTFLLRMRLRIIFQYYHELAKYDLNSEHISPLLKRLKKIEDLDRVISIKDSKSRKIVDIISLSNVNTSMKKVLPLLICKQIYDQKKKERNDNKFLNIIIDEAHNILSYSSQRESETWKDYRLETFEEIIKEGRKFGVFLTLASQRPSDISATIISQLHNYFLHRLINNKDIEAIEKTVSYLDQVSFESLPILPTGTCVLAGQCAQVPVTIEIDKIDDEYEPHNKTIKPTDYWGDE